MLQPLSDVLELIYPHQCVCCCGHVSESEDPICFSCRIDLPFLFTVPFSNNQVLTKKFEGLLPLKSAIAFLKFIKGGSTQRILHALKYGKRPKVGTVLGKLLAHEITDAGFQDRFDLILPIPLHRKKLKTRGYNQSMMFAEGLAGGFGTEANDQTLIRTTATETQTRKGKLQRILNVGEVFGLDPVRRSELAGKHILLVDDVITTGSTMEACGKILLQEPIGSLSIATLAMT